MQPFLDDHGPPPAAYERWSGEDPPAACPAPPGRVDVAIVGGGITGLSAACHLAGSGATVAVLEARSIGWGASGRAFGQVVPSLKHGNARIIEHYGPERGERIIADVAAGPDLVFDLIGRHGIACGAVRSGLLFGAHTARGRDRLERSTREWQRRGAAVEMLEAQAAAAAIGSELYEAAALDRRGGHINPLAYVRGLGRAAAGTATLCTGVRVGRIERQGRSWRLDTDAGQVTADSVIVATNAYTGRLLPALAGSIVPMRVHGAVTAPVRPSLLATILPDGQPLTDTRRLYSGVRQLPGGRMHVTVDGPAFGRDRPPYLHTADRRLAGLFRALADPVWEECWSGWIALTPEQLPRVHALGPGLYAGLGYSGRGLAAATMVGRDLARRVCGAPDRDVTFPLSPVTPFPGRRMATLPISAMIAGWRLIDRLDDARAHARRARQSAGGSRHGESGA